MPPIKITNVSPVAAIRMTDICRRIFCTSGTVMKPSTVSESTTPKTSMTGSIGSSRTSDAARARARLRAPGPTQTQARGSPMDS